LFGFLSQVSNRTQSKNGANPVLNGRKNEKPSWTIQSQNFPTNRTKQEINLLKNKKPPTFHNHSGKTFNDGISKAKKKKTK
jgi:hypothetical protein